MSTGVVTPVRKAMRVLIIEDYEEDAVLLERYLARAGFAVAVRRVESADQLMGALDEPQPWDLVLADYTLPSFGARDALQLIQQRAVDLPFIIVSGTIDEVSAVDAMRAGAHDYVLKGHLERLVPAIERELGEAERRRERLRTELELRLAQQRFSATFNQAAVGMAHTTVQGRFLLVNQRLSEMLDLSEERLRTLQLRDFLLPSEQGLDAALLGELLAGSREGYRVERHLFGSQGAAFPAQLTVSLLHHDGESGAPDTTLLWVVEDISARRTAERETADLMSKLIRSEQQAAAGRMANTLAHEINNPLEGLTNIFYLLQLQELPIQAQELVAIAARELERVGYITRSALSYYRKAPGRKVGLQSLLEEVIQLFNVRAAQQSIEIATRFGNGVEGARFDPQLRQVFANLIGNALEAMEARGGRIQVRARVRGSTVIALVSDNGHGVPKADLPSIFEPFVTTKGERGTGLGLWVTRGILEEQGGTLRLRTCTEGRCRGTTMRITLPVAPSDDETSGQAKV